MKNLRTIALCAGISLYSICSFAQNGEIPLNEPDPNKPKLFNTLPAKIPVSIDNISPLLDYPVGSTVSLNLSSATGFRFDGDVISAVSKYENSIRTVIIRSTNYPGARLTISKITAADGSISYSGRILSKEHGDVYELKNINNQFTLVKKNYHALVAE